MRAGLVVIAAVLVLGGCAHSAPPTAAPAVPVFSTAPVNAGAERTVPADCAAVATLDDLTRDLDNLVTGTVNPVVGVPQANIGRTARIDCYYGVPPKQPLARAKVWSASRATSTRSPPANGSAPPSPTNGGRAPRSATSRSARTAGC